MKIVIRLVVLVFFVFSFTCCDFRITHHYDDKKSTQGTTTDDDKDKKAKDDATKSKNRAEKLDAIYDNSKLGEITLTFTTDNWNKLLSNTNSGDKTLYSTCDFTFKKDEQTYTMQNIGIKNRGNTSFRAPEKTSSHTADGSQYQQAHFKLKFTKYEDDDAHHLEKAAKAMNLKYMLTDKSYVQEMYSYDLFKRFGVWTAPRCAYTKLYITVGSTSKAYFGMYKSIETIDKQYLKARVAAGQFNGSTGNLWKCLYQSGGPASLNDTSDYLFGVDAKGYTPVYSLKTNEDTTEGLNAAKKQFKEFISNLKSKSDSAFNTWIKSAFDVDGFLKALAVSVACGMWDDIWRNCNNYYMYFDEKGKAYFIPYDYDNSLGHPNDGLMQKPAEKNPLEWGKDNWAEPPLVKKILADDEFKAKYISYLSDLIDSSKDLFDKTKSVARINAWYDLIESDCSGYAADSTASKDGASDWSLAKGKPSSQYNLIEDDKNYFTIRTNAFKNAIQSSSTTTTTTTINNTKYTVTFDPNGGSFIGNYSGTEPITIKDIKYNTSVYELIDDVEKSDIMFFWWIDEDGNVVENITKNCTLTAYFEIDEYVLGYYCDTDTITFRFYPYMYGYQPNEFKTTFGDLYVVGSFSDWNVKESNKMIYDDTKKMYSLTLDRNLISDNSEFKYTNKDKTKWLGATDRKNHFTFEELSLSDFIGDKGNIKIMY